jgi:hypothetical protein
LQSVHSPIWARTASSDTIGSFATEVEGEFEVEVETGFEGGAEAGVRPSDTIAGPPSAAQLRYARSSATAAASSS